MLRLKAALCALALVATFSVTKAEAKASRDQLVIGVSQEFETLNQLISQTVASSYIGYMFSHPMTAVNASWQWSCWLCTDMPTIENGKARIIKHDGKDKLLVDWQIHKDAKWGDGTPVTGHDMELTWKMAISGNVSIGELEQFKQMEEFRIDAKNPKKFSILYDKPRFNYHHLGTFYLSPVKIEGPIWQKTKDINGAYEKQSAYQTDPTNPGLYNGAYLVTEVKAGSHIILERNPHFYGEKAKIKRLIFKIISNTQTLEANLLSGTIDMVAEIGMSFDQALSFQKRMGEDPKLRGRHDVRFREAALYEHIDLNLRNPVLQDLRVRQALVYGIDRQSLVEALFAGKQKVAIHNIHPLDPYFTDDVMKYPYSPEKARQLLDAAGWKVGKKGVRLKDGKPLQLTFMTTAGDKTRELVQVFLQQQWKKVGIDIKIKNEPARVYFGETVRKARFDHLAMYALLAAPDAPRLSTTHSREIPTQANGWHGQNVPGWSNKINDDAWDAVVQEFNIKKRAELAKPALQQYAKEVPVIPLYLRSDVAIVPANLKGFRMTGHQYYSTLSAHQWEIK